MASDEGKDFAEVGPWVVEWCVSGYQSGSFHVDTLSSAITNNVDCLMRRRNDMGFDPWIIVGIFDNPDEASAFGVKLQTLREADRVGNLSDDNRIVKLAQLPDNIEYLRSLPYAQYLETPYWRSVRRAVIERALFRCQLCYAEGELHVHHRTYDRRGAELASDVLVLCRECHDAFHDRRSVAKGRERER
jgi:hypothetical protein